MSTCQQCGIGNAPHRALCTTCGSALAKPAAAIPDNLSALWRIRFDLIEKAGGPTCQRFRQLSFGERFRLVFNIWAVLFGPIYYLAKGMWRKAITMLGLSVVAQVLTGTLAPDGGLELLNTGLNTMIGAWFWLSANINYYKKVVCGDNGWW